MQKTAKRKLILATCVHAQSRSSPGVGIDGRCHVSRDCLYDERTLRQLVYCQFPNVKQQSQMASGRVIHPEDGDVGNR